MIDTSANSRAAFRACVSGTMVLAAVFLAFQTLAAAPSGATTNASARNEKASANREDLIREGTLLERQVGVFQSAGDRIVFVYDGQRLLGLENLALERVVQIVRDLPTALQWTVDGVVTEYQGTNYLLVTKAQIKRGRNTAAPRF